MGTALQAALEKLDLVDVGHRAGLAFDRLSSSGVGPCCDPFRTDDKNPSFQIVGDGTGRAVGYKDYAGDATGNLWSFAKRCWPDKSAGDLAKLLIDMAGTADLEESAGSKPAMTHKERLAEKRKAARKQRANVESRYSDQLKMPPAAVPAMPPVACVVDRFSEGVEYALTHAELYEALVARRGWPVEWVLELIETFRLSLALLPWVDAGEGKQLRGWSFAVECPARPMHEGVNTSVVQSGYHQAFVTQSGKAWVFAPYMPASDDKARSQYQRNILHAYKSAGFEYGQKLIDPVPFIIGRYDAAFVVIVEGQWDAVTVFGALGGFSDGDWPNVLVFGLRGVQSGDQLLRYWGRLLKWLVIAGMLKGVWIIADADKAGKKLVKTTAVAGEVPTLSFAHRLQALLGVRLVTSYSRKAGEDFNDYYKDKTPSVSAMWGLVKKVGFEV